ncbi:MAG TPA: methyltransferase domain-containing protein [Rhizomicrobium sp.]|jgi:SAM-dependent methyltransferase|nr:methyltransferase domain-containing protein [Rhizomicrobium sp.]
MKKEFSKSGGGVEPGTFRVYAMRMQLDARDLDEFYETPMGQVARRMILRRLRLLWPSTERCRLLGFGFPVPYLRAFHVESERVVALMPAQQGVVCWPRQKPLAALGEEDAFPFPDAMFDRILVVHGIEGAESLRPVLRQLWRVLAPEGRMIVVAPNRTSLWAQIERSPFAHGRPFHRRELDRLLRECLFEPVTWDCALLNPPLRGRRLVRTGTGWDRLGRRFWPALGGVHLVEATKSLYAPVPVLKKKRVEPILARA